MVIVEMAAKPCFPATALEPMIAFSVGDVGNRVWRLSDVIVQGERNSMQIVCLDDRAKKWR